MSNDDIRDHSRNSNGDHSDHAIRPQEFSRAPKPGTSDFGQRAVARRAAIIEAGSEGDLRVSKARERAEQHKIELNKILKGD